MFASLTQHVGVKAADICVTLVNRLNGDQVGTRKTIRNNLCLYMYFPLLFKVDITKEQKKEWENRPFLIVGRYIEKLLEN